MKLLIATYPVRASHPHFFKPAHLKQIKSITKNKVEVRATADKKKAELYARDADIIAGHPGDIPRLVGIRNIKWVQSFSAGVDKLLTPEVIRSPIVVTNVSGIHATPIAEHVIGFMLTFTRRFRETWLNQTKHIWKPDQTVTELRGKTVLIAGLGNIGGEVARLSHCFGARVIAVSRNARAKPLYVDLLKTEKYLDSLLPEADFVCICLPHTKDTHHLFDMSKFKHMKRTAILINIGRGGIINEKELVAALKKKIIGGAALDVTEEEPLSPRSPLWDMENVIITPHHSGMSEKYMDRAIALFCGNLKNFLAGKPLKNIVNKKLGY
ncbi:MAG: D-2-hydroxyacid dehydrogenase [Candidatus Liptonbacteria bacterium]|nr:D-2-hydroxyacid dehydrogenase [Candidatus Liptonbacteria bacterium]